VKFCRKAKLVAFAADEAEVVRWMLSRLGYRANDACVSRWMQDEKHLYISTEHITPVHLQQIMQALGY